MSDWNKDSRPSLDLIINARSMCLMAPITCLSSPCIWINTSIRGDCIKITFLAPTRVILHENVISQLGSIFTPNDNTHWPLWKSHWNSQNWLWRVQIENLHWLDAKNITWLRHPSSTTVAGAVGGSSNKNCLIQSMRGAMWFFGRSRIWTDVMWIMLKILFWDDILILLARGFGDTDGSKIPMTWLQKEDTGRIPWLLKYIEMIRMSCLF